MAHGILATLVRLVYNEGYTTREVTISQYLLGLMTMALLILTNGKIKSDRSLASKNKYLYMGFPKTGIGPGGIIISIEILVSVSIAYVLIHEEILATQWLGIGLTIGSIVVINFRTLTKEFKAVNNQIIH